MSGFRVSGARRSAAVSWLASILGCVSTTLVAADAAAGSGVPWRVGQATHGEVPPEPLLEAIAIADRAIHARITERSSAEGLFEAFREGHRGDDESFRVRVDAVRRDLREARFAIDVREAPLTTLGAALAGFTAAGPEGRPLILVNRDLLAGSPDAGRSRPSSEFLAAILLEELGHALDHVINGPSDTPGDEGEAFSLAVLGLDASPAARRRIACEDDRRRITLAGRETVIEQATITFQTVYRTDLGESGQGFTPSSVLAGSSFRFTTDPPSAPTFEEARHGNAIPGTFTYLDPDGRSISFAGEIVRRTPVGSAIPTAVGFRTEESDDDGHDFIFAIGLNTLVPGTHYNTSANQIARRLDEYVAAQAPSAVNSSWSIEPTTLAADGIAAATVTVTVRNSATPAVPLAGALVVLERTGGVATIDGVNPAITGSDGRATFAVRSTVANVATFRVRCSRAGVEVVLANPSTIAVTFTASPSSRLAVIGQPTSGDSGVVLGTGFLVEVQDADGNRSTGDNFTAVTASIASGPAGAVLGGTLTQTASFGLATFDDLMITGPGGNYVLRFASPGLASADTAPIAICHPTIHYLDSDGDGFGGVNAQTFCSEPGPEWSTRPGDCDDGRASVNPAAPEICNGNDDDCDAAIDEDLAFIDYYFDVDGDGYGSGTSQSRCADPGSGWTTLGGDCDDALASINPAASETCNGLDDDCDGAIDDGVVFTDWYADFDGDGYGWMSAEPFCSDPGPGWSTQAGDCDDGDPSRNPGAAESCNGRDDDCDGSVDEDLAFTIYYQDLDGDGFSGANPGVFCADPGAGWSTEITDCNDANAAISPAAAEACNGRDDDCDGSTDEDLAFIDYYVDGDGDGYGGTAAETLCSDPGPGWTSTPGDCDDALASINPAASETCNGLDDDCDSSIDDGLVFTDWYLDADGDGYGDPAVSQSACSPPDGYVADSSDLCPSDPAKVTPGDCGCGIADLDADGSGVSDCLEDTDGDGVLDLLDGCPTDAEKTSPGICGCGVADIDGNDNWFLDCLEGIASSPIEAIPAADLAAGDEFGASMASHGDRVAVGLPGDDHAGLTDAGSVRVFRWDGSIWMVEGSLLAPAPAASERFGSAVALHGDVVVVGRPLRTVSGKAQAGVAEVFRRDAGGSWVHEATLTRAVPAASDRFGTAVAVRGEFIAVGAPQADPATRSNAGEVTVFRRSGGVWSATGTATGAPVTANDRFGSALALGGSVTAPTLASGCPGDDETGRSDCGALYLLDPSTAGTLSLRARLVGGATAGRQLGESVSVSEDGLVVVAGAPAADTSAGVDAGTALVWEFRGSNWLGRTLVPPSPRAGDGFGHSLSLDASGGRVVVGSPARTHASIAARGAATLFQRRGQASWVEAASLEDSSGGASASRFGTSVAFLVGFPLVGGPFQAPPSEGAVIRFATVRDCVGADTDADGMGDACDACPSDPTKIWGEQCGCGNAETDTDSDGTADCDDLCPADPAKVSPGTCGCGTSDVDSDSDGLADCLDSDDDNDGTADPGDGCPFDAVKIAPGACGCGVADTDSDSDSTPDCLDECDADPLKTAPGVCGCGVADSDSDGDELLDCLGRGLAIEQAALPVPTLATGDDYGQAIAVDGDTAVVGMPGKDLPGKVDAGAAVVLVRTEGTWSVAATLTAPDARTSDRFGLSVAISGDLIAVGAPLVDVSGTLNAGAVHLFRRTAGVWTPEAKLLRATRAPNDRFGEAVAASGDLVAVGCPLANAGGPADSGEVTVFRRESLVWSPRSNLVSSPVAAGDRLGQAVAFGGDAATPVLVIGAPGDDEAGASGCGAIYVHRLDANGLSTASMRFVAIAPSPSAALGSSIAIDASGTRVAAGAPLASVPGTGARAGLVTVWHASGGTWTAATIAPAGHAAEEQFGSCVSFDLTGTMLLAGSPLRTIGGAAGRGAATLFIIDGGAWSTYDRITLSVAGPGVSNLGRSGAFAGGTVLVGAPKHDGKGTVREFGQPGPG